MKAEIITIGDEILLGQVVDTNSAWLGQQLTSQLITVEQIISISDDRQKILDALLAASQRSDLVIVTGGLGPTKDDITKSTIADFFKTSLKRDEDVLTHVKAIFSRLKNGQEMPLSNYAQADVLASCEVLFNDVGTAPGMWVEHEEVIYVFMPGVPFEMKYIMEQKVLPKLTSYQDQVFVYHAHIITVGIGESHLAERIQDIEELLPSNIKLAYLPKFGLVRLRLTANGTLDKRDNIKLLTDTFADQIAVRLSDFLVAREDISIEQALIALLAEKAMKVAVAESCTGGKLAGAITAYAGASTIFDCGIVSYSNQIKADILGVQNSTLSQYGAVSEETVVEMATGIKKISGADYAIATSGIAGPGGGTPEKPVGTVWIAVLGQNNLVTKVFHFKNNREVNIERSVMQALIMLWNLVKKEVS